MSYVLYNGLQCKRKNDLLPESFWCLGNTHLVSQRIIWFFYTSVIPAVTDIAILILTNLGYFYFMVVVPPNKSIVRLNKSIQSNTQALSIQNRNSTHGQYSLVCLMSRQAKKGALCREMAYFIDKIKYSDITQLHRHSIETVLEAICRMRNKANVLSRQPNRMLQSSGLKGILFWFMPSHFSFDRYLKLFNKIQLWWVRRKIKVTIPLAGNWFLDIIILMNWSIAHHNIIWVVHIDS